jgi:RNA polymerase sigma factor (sigma-70 family)
VTSLLSVERSRVSEKTECRSDRTSTAEKSRRRVTLCAMEAPGSDRKLAERAHHGDVAAVDVLVDRLRCVGAIVTTMNSRLPRPLPQCDVVDVTQNALGAIWTKLSKYSGDSPIEAWAFGFCRVELRNAVRNRSRRFQVEPLLDTAADEPADRYEELDQIERALASIDSRRAEVIRLKHLDGLKFEEIASRECMSENTAKTLYYRGVQELQAILRRDTARGAT